MNRIYSVDRLGEASAVLIADDGREVSVSRDMLALGVKEGMLVRFREEDGLYCPDKTATEQRQEEMRRRVAALCNKSKGTTK